MKFFKETLLFCLTAPGIFFLILAACAFILKFSKRFKYVFLFICLVLTYISTTSALTKHMLHKLEGNCSFDIKQLANIDAIAIPTAGTEKDMTTDDVSKLSDATIKRLVAGAILYNELVKPIIVLGGITTDPEIPESKTASNILTSMGIPITKIITDVKSKNTFENIQELKNIIVSKDFKNVALISSASHLPRIKMLLKGLNLNITLLPTDCKASGVMEFDDFIPSIRNINLNRTLVYELLGQIKYAIAY